MTAGADVIDVPKCICDDRSTRCSLCRSSSCFRGLVRRLPGRRRQPTDGRASRHSTAERTADRSAVSYDDYADAQPTDRRAMLTRLVDVDGNVRLEALAFDRPTTADTRNTSTAGFTQSVVDCRLQSGTTPPVNGRRHRPKLTTLHASSRALRRTCPQPLSTFPTSDGWRSFTGDLDPC